MTQVGRFSMRDALELLKSVPLGQLMRMAYDEKLNKFSNNYVTFVFDTNPNYTNVCFVGCKFCAFWRKVDAHDAYLCTPRQIAIKVKSAWDLGATTVLLQGGLNKKVKLNDWLSYINEIKLICPDIYIHPFSPVECFFMAQQEGVSVDSVLTALWNEGITTIPGGGAEILTDNVRKVISKNKITSQEWLDVCEIAHGIGFKTTATMMFGHVETDEDIISHLFKLRSLQDLTGGFTSFIPWSFKRGETPLAKKIREPVHQAKYIRIIATARLILDNFDHVQSSWFSESLIDGQLGLLAGADDFGGVLIEENVHKSAGHCPHLSVNEIISAIKRVGFIPAQRDSHYNILKIYN